MVVLVKTICVPGRGHARRRGVVARYPQPVRPGGRDGLGIVALVIRWSGGGDIWMKMGVGSWGPVGWDMSRRSTLAAVVDNVDGGDEVRQDLRMGSRVTRGQLQVRKE